MEILLLALWGVVVSYVEERFGKFQNLKPNVKQLVNAILALIVPAIVTYWVNPWWQADFGNAEELVTSLLVLLAPVGVWLVSQLSHQIDRLLQNKGV